MEDAACTTVDASPADDAASDPESSLTAVS
jgi:hypothetical protein